METFFRDGHDTGESTPLMAGPPKTHSILLLCLLLFVVLLQR